MSDSNADRPWWVARPVADILTDTEPALPAIPPELE